MDNEPAARSQRRRRLRSLAFLAFGLLVASYLAHYGPKEQHVRVVLGRAAPQVSGVGLQYLSRDGDPLREAHFSYQSGAAPRIVAHEPKLPDGDYIIQIEIDAHDRRRSIQRQVTLGGGSTQLDVESAIDRDRDRESNEPAP